MTDLETEKMEEDKIIAQMATQIMAGLASNYYIMGSPKTVEDIAETAVRMAVTLFDALYVRSQNTI